MLSAFSRLSRLVLQFLPTRLAIMSETETLKRPLESDEAKNEEVKHKKVPKKRFRVQDYETPLDVSTYYIENGLRKVYPYPYTFFSFCKSRWAGRKVTELFQEEFNALTLDRINHQIKSGKLKVNDESIDSDRVLKFNDFVTNIVHRHELSVLAAPIPIVHVDDHILVIDKPPSVPVHPCGKYRLNSITSILKKENNIDELHVVHRLDRLTSGIMVMAKSKLLAQKLHEQMRNREMHKEYVCRVEGEFPDGVIVVDQPIETISHRIGICIVRPDGKPSKTTFERMNYNGKSSTVLCKPLTGRMHQIRVHLQYIGFPISNDKFYNNYVFGPHKGKGGEFGKSVEELANDIDKEHEREQFFRNESDDEKANPIDPDLERRNKIALEAMAHYTSQESWKETSKAYQFDASKMINEADDCLECATKTYDPMPCDQLIYLHAYRYYGKDWNYQTDMPVWARDTWTHD